MSPNEKLLAVTNLYDGIDWYALNSNHFMEASFQHTTTHTIHENVIHPLTFIHGNAGVLSGTSHGCARITTVKDWSLLERLQHDREGLHFFLYEIQAEPENCLNSRRHCASCGTSRHVEMYT